LSDVHLTVLGARGSIPVSGPEFVRHGGNTTSFALVVDGAAVGFVDAGTGFNACETLGVATARNVSVLLTHYHWDHIQGLSMSNHIWNGTVDMIIRGPADPATILTRAISPPLFPVSIGEAGNVEFASVDGPVDVAGVTVYPFPVHHPQGALGYLLRGPNRAVAIVTDHEAGTEVDEAICSVIAGVDVLIHDAQYLPEEAPWHAGWGHSTFEDAIEMTRAAGAGELVLTSHDPSRTDAALDGVVAAAREGFAQTQAAFPGLTIPL